MLVVGVVVFAAGVAGIIAGASWNIWAFRRTHQSSTQAVQTQVVGIGLSLLGAALISVDAGAPAGPISVAGGVVLALAGLAALVLSRRIQSRP